MVDAKRVGVIGDQDVRVRQPHGRGVRISRLYTKAGQDPFADVAWEFRDARITNPDGTVVFEMKDVEAPVAWSQTAVDIAASKYFRKRGVPGVGKETSVRAMVSRVADAIVAAGKRLGGYFASEEDAQALRDELCYMLVHQIGAFNSPVWFNCGLAESYGIKGDDSGNWCWDPATDQVVRTTDAYTRPAISACFIVTVQDDLMDIAEHVKREMRIFRFGGGSGGNYSNLRAEGEPLSGGGASSGVMSFLDVFDKSAGAIKSGGTTRRAAKMVVLDVDHPDVEKFVEWKVREEEKVRALVAAGWSSDFNGEAYRTVGGQNANNSVSVTDEFMRAVVADGDWNLTWRRDGKVARTVKAKQLFRKIAEAAWKCADPGLQFSSTMNRWHTIPASGPIRASNPCQPGWATLLTPSGIRTMSDICAGDVIWSGKRWTKVIKKFETGVKQVYAFRTRGGTFYGTENHRVLQFGEKVEAKDAESIDIAAAIERDVPVDSLDPQDVMDGLVLGDGAVFSALPSLPPLLLIGKDDHDYFGSEVKDLLVEQRERFIKYAWAVRTTLERHEVPRTYERKVPERFRNGTPTKVRGFLRGLYSANGSICGGNRITLKATSFSVIETVQEMLSSIGIRSYYTVNKPHEVDFENGTYLCKQSYDLNVTVDRRKFRDLIGFIQKGKQERLEEACLTAAAEDGTIGVKPAKTAYEIVERELISEEPVYDITVDDEDHAYWTGGMLVSNCSEYLSIDDTSCNLASLNLMKFMRFEGGKPSFDCVAYEHACRSFIVAMDILVDHASYPTREIAQNTHDYRQLGLGYANLGAAIMAQGLAYDSPSARSFAAAVTAVMSGTAYATSADLAASKGAFAGHAKNAGYMRKVMYMHRDAAHAINPEGLAAAEVVSRAATCWQDAVSRGEQAGYRNAQCVVLAPTGTIGLLMDCDTTGVEPDFALVKGKKLAGGGFMKITNGSVDRALETLGYPESVRTAAVNHVLEHGTVEGAPGIAPAHYPAFDCAVSPKAEGRAITPMGHVRMVAAVQPFLSGSASKTVNMPESTTVEEIEQIYLESWMLGLKCVSVYRDNCKASQPLAAAGKKDESNADPKIAEASAMQAKPQASTRTERHRLPKKRHGFTQEARIAGHKVYVRTGEYEDGTLGEIFIDTAKDGAAFRSLMNSFAIAVSIGLQHGVPLDEFVNVFTFTKFEPSGPVSDHPNIKNATSIVDFIFRMLALEYLGRTDLVQVPPEEQKTDVGDVAEKIPHAPTEKAKAAMKVVETVKEAVKNAPPSTIAAAYQAAYQTVVNGRGGNGKNGNGKHQPSKSTGSEFCSNCGGMTVRTGTCTTCLTCGTAGGCG